MAYAECLPTRLNPLAERTCFSQVTAAFTVYADFENYAGGFVHTSYAILDGGPSAAYVAGR